MKRYMEMLWTLLYLHAIYVLLTIMLIFSVVHFFSEFRLVIIRANFHLSPLTCPIEIANVKFKLLNFLFLPHFPQLITLLFSKDILFNIRPDTVCPLAQPKHIELFFTLTYPSNHHSQFTKPSWLYFQIDLKPFNTHPNLSHDCLT